MKPAWIILALLVGAAVGAPCGWLLARRQARAAVLCGPYSDNYGLALEAIAKAKAGLSPGDRAAALELGKAEAQIRQAQAWTQRFLGQETSSSR